MMAVYLGVDPSHLVRQVVATKAHQSRLAEVAHPRCATLGSLNIFEPAQLLVPDLVELLQGSVPVAQPASKCGEYKRFVAILDARLVLENHTPCAGGPCSG